MLYQLDDVKFSHLEKSYHLHKTTNTIPRDLKPMHGSCCNMVSIDGVCNLIREDTDLKRTLGYTRRDAVIWSEAGPSDQRIAYITAINVGVDASDTTHMLQIESYSLQLPQSES